MSEEKLYAVKNDEGKYFDCEYADFLPLSESYCPVMVSEDNAKSIVHDYGGHVVTLIEEPKKVVLSEKQAKIIEGARDGHYPASRISLSSDNDEELLMRAYVNGWTVEKPKRYVLPMPYGADDDDPDDSHYAVVNRQYHAGPAWHQGPCVSFKEAREHYSVTQAEIDASPGWVKAITPVEVTDDDQ
ncbi:DUF1642 domain-containing protein [Lacticaseibacillus paracasei]|uniref:DUF1642 domain-containing protein n=1 Tax=Lacticaseibacillus paracasei TaxID=1597 RepID=UPI00137823FE|nr:DUF1642 domain-containing protein [Lacticaseibacillus paracasei]MCZ2765762.1 DUF1642 domain-containing protein [Lacticaseibacillus paracasei]MCZ2768725.1 DUF1642 domain-containing protein [Lacticaseibacillus paracasei]MCZ2774315.1 DUF1642 domain-containing protein [Lacticaseibacillus paracasei]MCZ2777199.1 DUF1642 domain-containing protein [Lacticaseibacillus paracasei]MCZ2783228.1 DUF1642 domain-containing protein [Lacticaseibacillus paracasei]